MASQYTKDYLDDLRYKREVVAVAEELGISTEGTRAEITDRIVAFAEAEKAAEVVEDSTTADEASVDTTVDDSAEVDTLSGLQFSDAAYAAAADMTAVYFGVASREDEDMQKTITDALRAGHQPCIKRGRGNDRYELEVFAEEFAPYDVRKDVRVGVVMNLARFLAGKNLYPRG